MIPTAAWYMILSLTIHTGLLTIGVGLRSSGLVRASLPFAAIFFLFLLIGVIADLT